MKFPYVIVLAIFLTPMVLKKELKELKLASVLLFTGVSLFLIINSYNLLFEKVPNPDTVSDEYFQINYDLSFIKGLSSILVAFMAQFSVFPVYKKLEQQSNENC